MFLHAGITDAVEEIKLAALKGKIFHSYYIGNAVQKPLKSFVLAAKQIINSRSVINFGAIPFRGMYFEYKDVIDVNAITNLGFTPKIDFETGVKLLAENL